MPAELTWVTPDIKGNHPARTRIIVNEQSGVTVNGLMWAVRSRHYDPAATARLAYEAEAMTPLDAAAIATVAGASGGGSNNAVRHQSLAAEWTPVLSTDLLSGGALTHTGSYRVWARVLSTSSVPPAVRLLWDVGDMVLPVENARSLIPAANGWYVCSLGQIRFDRVGAGTHRWKGVIQAQGPVGGENIAIDRVYLQPLDEGAGVLRSQFGTSPGLDGYIARDEFTGTIAGNALNGRTAPVGGSWATSGATTDFTFEDSGGTHERVTRTISGQADYRFAVLGPAIANTVMQALILQTSVPGTEISGILARWIDANNHLRFEYDDNTKLLAVIKVVSGTPTTLASVTLSGFTNHYLRLQVLADGAFLAEQYGGEIDGGEWVIGGLQQKLTGIDGALATGGALASGKVGLADRGPGGAGARDYDNVLAWSPTIDAVIHANQSCELRWNGMIRETADGGSYGPVSHREGRLPRLPVSGLEQRPVEVFLLASRGDFDQLPDTGLDAITAQIKYRPCWLFAPAP